jgi:hypothetical protein
LLSLEALSVAEDLYEAFLGGFRRLLFVGRVGGNRVRKDAI